MAVPNLSVTQFVVRKCMQIWIRAKPNNCRLFLEVLKDLKFGHQGFKKKKGKEYLHHGSGWKAKIFKCTKNFEALESFPEQK